MCDICTFLCDQCCALCSFEKKSKLLYNPSWHYLLEVNYRSTRTRCAICSKITKNTTEWCQWRCSKFLSFNFKHFILCSVFQWLSLSVSMTGENKCCVTKVMTKWWLINGMSANYITVLYYCGSSQWRCSGKIMLFKSNFKSTEICQVKLTVKVLVKYL